MGSPLIATQHEKLHGHSLQWRHDGPHHCLLNRLFWRNDNFKAPRYWLLVREIRRSAVNSPHKGPVTRKMFPFDDVIMTGACDRFCRTPKLAKISTANQWLIA